LDSRWLYRGAYASLCHGEERGNKKRLYFKEGDEGKTLGISREVKAILHSMESQKGN
jgi:hypothetical protein